MKTPLRTWALAALVAAAFAFGGGRYSV